MGMFSYLCKGCGQELIEGEMVRLNGCKGEYDGYGGAGGFEDDTGNVAAWHARCYKAAPLAQREDETPSKSAPNQGFGPAHLEFLPGYEPLRSCLFYVHVRGRTANDSARKPHRESIFAKTIKGWVDTTLWTEDAEKPIHAKDIVDPLDCTLLFKTLDEAIREGHHFVKALRDGACDTRDVLEDYTIYVFGRQGSPELEDFAQGIAYEYQRKEIIQFNYGEVPGYTRTGEYKDVTYRIGCKTEPEPAEPVVDPDASHLAAIEASIQHLEGCLEQLKKLAQKYKKTKAPSKK